MAVALAAALLVSGCSSTVTSSVYPAVLDDPPPRDGTTLSPAQVKQAMDTLISDRNRLCAQATANSSAAAPPSCGAQDTMATGTTPNPGAGATP
jgi:hypothetical protein